MKVVICIPLEVNQQMVVLVLNRVVLVLNSLRVGKMLAKHIEVAINLNIFFHSICTNLFTCVFLIYKILYIDAEAENDAPNVSWKRRRTECVIQEEGCTPTTTYLSDISDIPWESNMQKCTLKMCQHLHEKLKRDLMDLTVPAESRRSLEIVSHCLSELVDVYRKLGPTIDTFVEVMRKKK